MVEKRVNKFVQGSPPPFSGSARKKMFFSYKRCSLRSVGTLSCQSHIRKVFSRYLWVTGVSNIASKNSTKVLIQSLKLWGG